MQRTKIEYLDVTWNPLKMRCTPVSEGCSNCWHLRMCYRQKRNMTFPQAFRLAVAGGDPLLVGSELGAPLRSRGPARIGVQFMGDLFHEKISGQDIASIYNVMLECGYQKKGHKFFVLTKRLQRIAEFFGEAPVRECVEGYLPVGAKGELDWPDYIWTGTSCENQRWADIRILELLHAPVGPRFVSFEPLLGPINVKPFVGVYGAYRESCKAESEACPNRACSCPTIDWAIIGCEAINGRPGRHCRLAWVRELSDQLREAGVPTYVKQLVVNGKLTNNPADFPADLRFREIPEGAICLDSE